jgi:hypothetical protein
MMHQDQDRLRKIAQAVLDKTEQGELEWKRRGASTNHFFTALGDRPLAIWSEDEDDVAPFRLSFGNERQVEIAYLESIMGATQAADQEHNRMLTSLYRAAKSQAFGIDRVLDNLERDLGL